MSISTVFINGCFVALFQGFGAIPLYFFNDFSGSTASFLTISASGMMIGTGFLLILSVIHDAILSTMIGIIFGWVLVWLSSIIIEYLKPNMDKSSQQIIIVILTMTLHSLGEGSSIGVAAGTSNSELSSNVILSLAIHNIPEGLATCLYLVGRGMNKYKATLYSMACDFPLPLTAVPAFIFVDTFEKLLSASLGFAAGAMFYISFMELIPECLDLIPSDKHLDRLILWIIFFGSIAFIFVISD